MGCVAGEGGKEASVMSCLDPGNKLRYLGRARRSHYNKSPLFFHHNQTCVKHGIGRLFEFRLFLTLIYNTDLRDDRGDGLSQLAEIMDSPLGIRYINMCAVRLADQRASCSLATKQKLGSREQRYLVYKAMA